MLRLKIILQSNNFYLLLLLLSLIVVFIRINYVKNESIITPSNFFVGIITYLDYDGEKYKINIKNREEVIGYYYSDEILNFNLGDKIEVSGIFEEPKNNTIPNTFNYKKYLNNHKIFYQIKINTIKLAEKNHKLRFKVKNFILEKTNDFKNKGYIKAFIIGDKTDLENYKLFQTNGVSHLFALSGMHISLLAAIIYLLLKNNRWKNIIVIIFLILYLMITNYSASLIRSILFFILLVLNKKYSLNISTKNVLLLTVVLLLLYNSYYIYDYGFLYSAVVTYGLIICKKYYRNNYFYNLFITSIAAFLFSLPITISLNYEINLLSIINNIIVVPLISIIVYPLSLITFIIPFLEPLLSFMIFVLEKINWVLSLVSINVVIPKINTIVLLFYYLFLLLFIKSNNYKYLLINLLLLIVIKMQVLMNNNTEIYFLDVGQGDSALLIYKNELTLIDTGGAKNRNISDNIITLIKSLGYSHIDNMVLTHGDLDHQGEAVNLVKNIKIKTVVFNCGKFNELETELIKELDKERISYYSCIKEITMHNNKLYFLQTKEYDNENDNSSVIYTEINGYRLMFMGDAGITKEKDVLDKYNISNVDVLKVGHHGSKTSSSEAFVNKINPKYSIISVGKNNRYGHPNKEVLKILEDSKIYRTDKDGSIKFRIKSNKLKVETCNP